MTKRLFITGGSGYLGSEVVRLAISRGYEVTSIDLNYPDRPTENVKYVVGDVLDREVLFSSIDEGSTVINCVAQVPLARSKKSFRDVNINGTRNVIEAAQYNHATKVVHVSTSAIYGVPKFNPVTESSPPKPVESYGKAKLEAERICKTFQDFGMDITIVRPRTIIGAGRLGIFGLLFRWISEGLDVYVIGPGTNIYQFIHVEDLADALIKAAEKPGCDIFNIGAPDTNTMRQTLTALCDYAGTGSRVRSLPRWFFVTSMSTLSRLKILPFAKYHWKLFGESLWFDTSHVEEVLSFAPKYSSSQALIDSFRAFLENPSPSRQSLSEHQKTPESRALNGISSILRKIQR